jgi:hypothetical protein
MTSSTRRFLAGSAIVVVAGLCTGLVAYYSGALAARDASTELSYIPADVSAVAFADVRDIMDSGFSRRIREVLPTGDDKNRMLAETGIDIERDIDTVVAGLSGSAATGGVVILRGRFDRDRIEELAVGRGAHIEDYGGRPMLVGLQGPGESVPDGAPASTHVAALAFLDTDLLALGDVDAVRRAIDAGDGGQDVASDADMMGFIERVQGSGNAWFVGRAGEWLTRSAPIPGEVRSQFDAIEWLSVSADIDQDVRGVARAQVRDDASAEQLRTVLAGGLAALRMMGQQDPRFASALNSIQATGTGRDVELAFTIPASVLEAMHGSADVPAAP